MVSSIYTHTYVYVHMSFLLSLPFAVSLFQYGTGNAGIGIKFTEENCEFTDENFEYIVTYQWFRYQLQIYYHWKCYTPEIRQIQKLKFYGTNSNQTQISISMYMGWLRVVGSLKLYVSFANEPYKRNYILQRRLIILRSLLIEATPYQDHRREWWVHRPYGRVYSAKEPYNRGDILQKRPIILRSLLIEATPYQDHRREWWVHRPYGRVYSDVSMIFLSIQSIVSNVVCRYVLPMYYVWCITHSMNST